MFPSRTAVDNRRTLAAGGALGEDVEVEDVSQEVDWHLDRYVISPLFDIDMTDMNMTGAISIPTLIARRINRLKDVTYRVRDSSAEALLDSTIDIDAMPLVNLVNTAYGQEQYVVGAYKEKGVRSLPDIKGRPVREIAAIEEVLLPEHFSTLLQFYGYVSGDEPEKRIKESELSAPDKKTAKKILGVLREGSLVAGNYAQDILAETKAEIVNSRNGKAGKSSIDPMDNFLHEQTGIPRIVERDIQYQSISEAAKDGGNDKLAEAILKLADASGSNDQSEIIKKLQEQLAALTELVAKKK